MPSRFSQGLAAGTALRQQKFNEQQVIEERRAAQIKAITDQADAGIKAVLEQAAALSKEYSERGGDQTQYQQLVRSMMKQAKTTATMAAQNGYGIAFTPETIEALEGKLLATPNPAQIAQTQGEAKGKGLVSEASAVSTGGEVPLEQAQIARGLRPAPVASTTVNVNTAESIEGAGQKKATEKFGEGIGDRADKRFSQAFEGTRQNQQLDRVKLAISRGASTGLGEETILDLRNLASTFVGVPVSEKMGEQELIRTVSNEMALRLRNPDSGLGLTGNTSNKDLDFLKASVVGLARTEQGNLLIIDMMQKFNNLKVAVANEQQRIIDDSKGIVPLDLDKKLIQFVNKQDILTPIERKQIELMSKPQTQEQGWSIKLKKK